MPRGYRQATRPFTTPSLRLPSSIATSAAAAMGKSKKNRTAARFDPLARPAASSSMDADDHDEDMGEKKELSAHRARHMERKRLQAEAADLRSQKGKISKADKIAHKREQKLLSMQLKVTNAALRGVARSGGLLEAAADATPEEPVAPAPFAGFNLPVPAIDTSMFAACNPRS